MNHPVVHDDSSDENSVTRLTGDWRTDSGCGQSHTKVDLKISGGGI